MPDPVHLLVVEDDAVARDALAELLRDEGFRVTTAPDGHEALAAIARDPPALVISDVRMPHGDGFQLVCRLREQPATAHLPVLLVSALGTPERRAAGIELGADDFLTKPVDFAELLARVRSHLRHAQDREHLERRALIDGLTGILNRRGINEVLQREVARARRHGSLLSLLMVDIDRFKALNDDHGHQAGDTVLRHVATALTDAVRLVDHVGRFGGDEFLVVLPDTDAPAADALAARLRTLRLPSLALGTGPDVEIAVSIGAATLQPAESATALLERADRAMYRAKRTTGDPLRSTR